MNRTLFNKKKLRQSRPALELGTPTSLIHTLCKDKQIHPSVKDIGNTSQWNQGCGVGRYKVRLRLLVFLGCRLQLQLLNPFTPSPHNNIKPPHAENSGAVGEVCGVTGAGAVLPYLEITHIEPHCHVGLCLIKPNTLWKLFGLDVPNVISAQVDGRKLTLGTSSWRKRVKARVATLNQWHREEFLLTNVVEEICYQLNSATDWETPSL